MDAGTHPLALKRAGDGADSSSPKGLGVHLPNRLCHYEEGGRGVFSKASSTSSPAGRMRFSSPFDVLKSGRAKSLARLRMNPHSWHSKHGEVTGGGSCLGCGGAITWVQRADGAVAVDLNDEPHLPQCPNVAELRRALKNLKRVKRGLPPLGARSRRRIECWHCASTVPAQMDGAPRSHRQPNGAKCPASRSLPVERLSSL